MPHEVHLARGERGRDAVAVGIGPQQGMKAHRNAGIHEVQRLPCRRPADRVHRARRELHVRAGLGEMIQPDEVVPARSAHDDHTSGGFISG